MFSKLIQSDIKKSTINLKNKNVESILEKIELGARPSLGEAWTLINVDPEHDPQIVSRIIETSRQVKTDISHGEIYPVVPLYVSSVCQEQCKYCNYRAGNNDKKIQRLRLSDEELIEEVEFLVRKGFRVIELVYATDPYITSEDVANHIRITHDILSNFGGGMVGINARSYLIEDYKKLSDAKLDFAVLWQETYDKTQYNELHPGKNEKTNFDYRLDAPERMIQGGIKNIGLGILSGLSDWKKDWFMLMNHADYLLREHKDKINTIILGTPRLKPAEGALLKETQFIPSDKEFLLAISVFNLFLPTAMPFVNTREKWNLCIEMAKGGGSLFTFNCKTIPGGYAHDRQGYQFPTYDFDIEEFIMKLNGSGLKPVFNWKFGNKIFK